MYVYNNILSASLVEKRLAYRATCFIRVFIAVVRLVTSAQYSAVACVILVNAMEISMT